MLGIIRNDLFAVKERQDGNWVTVCISKSEETAKNYARILGIGQFAKPKLFHPSQNTVDLFILLGNSIE